MRRQLFKLTFAVTALMLVLAHGSSVRATNDNFCECYNGHAYLYYDPPGAPWTFLNEEPVFAQGYMNDDDTASDCASLCRDVALNRAGYLCSQYSSSSYPNRHYQIDFGWSFYDPDGDSGGNGSGGYDSGWAMLMCP
jgi:hypothetical protein